MVIKPVTLIIAHSGQWDQAAMRHQVQQVQQAQESGQLATWSLTVSFGHT